MKSRLFLALPALALAAVSLTACTTTTSSCANGVCSVTLSGAGAETEINNDTVTVTLVGVTDGSAEFAVDGTSATCAQGDEQQVGQYNVVCTEVGEDKVTLEIS